MKIRSLFPLIVISLLLAACAPQVTVTSEVTATFTATVSLTSTLQPTSTPIPPPTITFTPTAVQYSADQLSGMSEDEKIAAAREMAGESLEGKTLVIEKTEVVGSEVRMVSTYRTTDEYGKGVVREYLVNVVDLETGISIPGFTPKELSALYAERKELPEKFVFDREILTQETDTTSALARAQEATYRGVEYPAEVTVFKNSAGEIVLVDWPYWPGGPSELMSYSASADGKLVELNPVVMEEMLTLENLSASERQAVFARLMRDQKNADLLEVVNDPEGVVIAVNGLADKAKGYWEGDEAESRKTALMHWVKQVNERTKGYTFDLRGPGVGVAFMIRPESVVETGRTSATWEGGKYVAAGLAELLAATNQDSKSFLYYDRYFDDPYGDITEMLREFGVGSIMFDTK